MGLGGSVSRQKAIAIGFPKSRRSRKARKASLETCEQPSGVWHRGLTTLVKCTRGRAAPLLALEGTQHGTRVAQRIVQTQADLANDSLAALRAAGVSPISQAPQACRARFTPESPDLDCEEFRLCRSDRVAVVLSRKKTLGSCIALRNMSFPPFREL